LKIPDKKYLVADAGYGLQPGLMTPYWAVRYHLKEQAAAGLRPATPKELYNLRHASLRNIVERLFGVFKKKFTILKSPPEIDLSKQIRLVYSLCVLWNFIRKHESLRSLLEEIEINEAESRNSSKSPDTTFSPAVEDARLKIRRDRIARKMWEQYMEYTSQRTTNTTRLSWSHWLQQCFFFSFKSWYLLCFYGLLH
jgi:hypothetical protein